MSGAEPRRLAPRITLDGFCGVVARQELRHATMLDLSASGLRLERPFDARTASPVVQLEIELPGADEIVSARARVARAHLSPMGGRHPDGQPRLWCRAGLVIDDVAVRDRRLLREYVFEMRRARAARAREDREQPRGRMFHARCLAAWGRSYGNMLAPDGAAGVPHTTDARTER